MKREDVGKTRISDVAVSLASWSGGLSCTCGVWKHVNKFLLFKFSDASSAIYTGKVDHCLYTLRSYARLLLDSQDLIRARA